MGAAVLSTTMLRSRLPSPPGASSRAEVPRTLVLSIGIWLAPLPIDGRHPGGLRRDQKNGLALRGPLR